MNTKEAIEDIKLSKSTFLFGREQTIVNIEAIDIVLNELRHKTKENKQLTHKVKTYRGMVKKQGRELSKLQKLIQEKN